MKCGRGHRCTHTIAHVARTGTIGAGHNHHELLAAETRHKINIAHLLLQHSGQTLQHLVSKEMAVAVVDAPESVDVDDQQGKELAETAGTLDFFNQALIQRTPVVQPGQCVGGCQVQGALIQIRVLDRAGSDVREGSQQLNLLSLLRIGTPEANASSASSSGRKHMSLTNASDKPFARQS